MPLKGVGRDRRTAAGCVGKWHGFSGAGAPDGGEHERFSPEHICLDVGRNRALARFARGNPVAQGFFGGGGQGIGVGFPEELASGAKAQG